MKVVPWTEDESQVLFNLKQSGKSYKEISDILDSSFGRRRYTENSCKKKWNDTNWDTFSANKDHREKQLEMRDDMDTERRSDPAETGPEDFGRKSHAG